MQKPDLYYEILAAFQVEIIKDFSEDDPRRHAAAKLSEACLIAALVDPYFCHSSEFSDLIVECSRYRYECWISCVGRAMADADFSFLPEPELSKMRLHVAFEMASGWLLQLHDLRKGEALPPMLE